MLKFWKSTWIALKLKHPKILQKYVYDMCVCSKPIFYTKNTNGTSKAYCYFAFSRSNSERFFKKNQFKRYVDFNKSSYSVFTFCFFLFLLSYKSFFSIMNVLNVLFQTLPWALKSLINVGAKVSLVFQIVMLCKVCCKFIGEYRNLFWHVLRQMTLIKREGMTTNFWLLQCAIYVWPP